MICPNCYGKTTVLSFQLYQDNTKRYRECRKCGHKFVTIEVDEDMLERLIPQEKKKKSKWQIVKRRTE
jgi:transcriptional regulator NrdR family protein